MEKFSKEIEKFSIFTKKDNKKAASQGGAVIHRETL